MKSKLFTKPVIGFLIMILFGLVTKAQEKDSQIRVKITREIDGEQKTYEGSYESEEQMREDENLKEFMGEDDRVDFFFNHPNQQGVFEYDEDEGDNHYFFRFGDEDGEDTFAEHFRMIHPNDSMMKEFEIRMEELHKYMGEMDEEMREKLEKLHHGHIGVFGFDDEDFNFTWSDSLAKYMKVRAAKGLQEMDEGMQRTIEISVKKIIKISEDVGEEFGKKGTVKESNKLNLEGLSYYPNPSPNGRFKLRFKTPGEGALSIKVYNLEGKEVFNRYFERFNGLYSETVDLSGQEEGTYLLEVQQDGKRLTRKIVIN